MHAGFETVLQNCDQRRVRFTGADITDPIEIVDHQDQIRPGNSQAKSAVDFLRQPFKQLHGEIMKSKRTYTEQEMIASGLIKPDEANCKQCHNDKGPTKPDTPFDFDTMKAKEGEAHENFPLKQRSG